MSSIACLKRSLSGWDYHFVLAKADEAMGEDQALAVATADLGEAFAKRNAGGSDESLAMDLKERGYVSVDDFNVVDPETEHSAARLRQATAPRISLGRENGSSKPGDVAAASAEIDLAALLSGDPFVVVARSAELGLRCHLQRADPCCGGDREIAIVAQPVRVASSGTVTETGEPPLDMRIGIDCGYFYYAAGGLVDTASCSVPGLAELQAATNGQALDVLAKRWLAERGQECRAGSRRAEMRDVDWQPGQPLSWSDAFEELREENLHGSLGCYAVFDLYFVEPARDAPEVILHFGEGPHGPTKDVGATRLDLETGDIEFMPNQDCAKLLEQLWHQYRQRYPDFSHLQARWAQMREFGVGFCSNRS